MAGLSKPRKNKEFNGLELQDRLAAKRAVPRCAIVIIDLRSGDAVHWLRLDGAVEELYGVTVLPDCRRPMAIGFVTDEVRRVFRMPPVDAFGAADPTPRLQAIDGGLAAGTEPRIPERNNRSL